MDDSPKAVFITLEVKLPSVRESFDVTIEPGSYVSDLVTETLAQCNVKNTRPEHCELLLISKTSVIPLEDEDLFNSININSLDEGLKLVLKEAESSPHVLQVYYHEREDHRIKYSFIVDETTTAGIICDSMTAKLNLDKTRCSYKLMNCVPAGDDNELQPEDIPLLMNTDYLEFRIHDKSKIKRTPSKQTNRGLKKLKKQTKEKTLKLPSPPSSNDAATIPRDLLSPVSIGTASSLSPHTTANVSNVPLPSTSVPTSPLPPTSVPTSPSPSTSVPTSLLPFASVPTSPLPSTNIPTLPLPLTDVPIFQLPSETTPTNKSPYKGTRVLLPPVEGLDSGFGSSSGMRTAVPGAGGSISPPPTQINPKSDATRLANRVTVLERELTEQYNRAQAIERDLKRAQASIKAKSKQISQYEIELEQTSNAVKEKQAAIDTLSDLLNSGQEEIEQLREQSMQLSGSLYQDLIIGRVGLAVEIDQSSTRQHLDDFSYEEVSSPISAGGAYIVINRVSPGFTKLAVGDLVLEVNGYSCRGAHAEKAVQELEECTDELHLVIARAQQPEPSMLASYNGMDDDNGGLDSGSSEAPPLPLSPVPDEGKPSTNSLDQLLGDVLDKSNGVRREDDDRHFKELAELRNEIEQLKEVIEDNERREGKLLKELELVRKAKGEAMAQIATANDLLQDKQLDKGRYKKQFEEIEAINSSLTRELNEVREQLQAEVRKRNKMEELQQLKNDNDVLQDKLTKAAAELEGQKQRHQAELSAMTEKLKEKEEVMSTKLKEAKDHVDQSAVREYEKQLTSLQIQLEEVKTTSKEDKSKLQSEVERTEGKYTKLLSEYDEIKKQNSKREEELGATQKQLQVASESLTEAQRLHQAHEETQKSLMQEVEREKTAIRQEMSEMSKTELKKVEMEHLKAIQEKEKELENARKNISSLEVKVQALESLQQDRMALLESDLQNTRKQSDRKEDKIAEKDDRINQLHFSLKELTLEQQKDIHQRMREFEAAHKELLVYKEKVHILEVDKKLQQERMSVLDNESQTMKNQLEKKDEIIASKDSQIAELHTSIKEVNAEVRALSKQLFEEKERAVELSEKAEKLKIELTKYEVEQEKLKQQITDEKRSNESLHNECVGVKKEKESLERKLTEVTVTLDSERTANKTENDRSSKTIEELKSDLHHHRQLLETSQREASQYKETVTKQISALEQELQSVKQQSEKKGESVTDKEAQMGKMSSLLEERSTEINRLQEQLKGQTNQIQTLSESLKDATGTVTSLEAANEVSNSTIQKLEAEARNMSTEINQLKKELSTYEQAKADLESSRDRLSTEKTVLQSELEKKLREMETQIKTSKDNEETLNVKISELTKEVDEYSMRCSKLTSELTELQNKGEATKDTMEKEKQEMALKLASIEQQLAAANGELTTQRNSYALLESKTNTLYEQLGYFKADKEKFDDKLINAVEEKERLRQELEATRAELSKSSNDFQKLENEKKREIEIKRNELKSSHERAEQLTTDVKELQKKLEQAIKDNEERIHTTTLKHNEELDAMSKMVENLQEEITSLQNNKTRVTEELRKVRQEIDDLVKEKSKLNEGLNRLKEEYSALEKSKQACVEDLEKERSEYSSNIKKFEQDSTKIQEELQSQLTKAKTESKQFKDDLQKQSTEFRNNEKKLTDEVEKYKAQVDGMTKEIDSLNKYIEKLLPVVMEFEPSVLSVKQSFPSVRY